MGGRIRAMNRLYTLLALTIATFSSHSESRECRLLWRAVSYKGCDGCGEPDVTEEARQKVPVAGGTYTCMKTIREIVYDRVEEIRYRSRREVYYEDKEVQRTRLVPETVTKDVQYTVMVPKYETKNKTTEYTVMKPVYETKERVMNYTVRKPVYENHTKEWNIRSANLFMNASKERFITPLEKPVYETHTKTVNYTVCKPVYETKQRTIKYTVCVPKYETRQRTINYTVYNTVREEKVRTENYTVLVPEHYTKTIKVRGGHWETQSVCVPGPKMRKLVRQPGCWKYDKARGCLQTGPVPNRDDPMPTENDLQKGVGPHL